MNKLIFKIIIYGELNTHDVLRDVKESTIILLSWIVYFYSYNDDSIFIV